MIMSRRENRPGCDRRAVLRGAGAAALGVAFLPFLRRRAFAAPGPAAKARRILILNMAGGVRSSAAFHASPQIPYNPYGLMTTTGTPPFALGRLLDDTAPGMAPLADAEYMMGAEWQNVMLPRLREIATQFSVLGTYSPDRGDHLRARIEEPTGSASGGDPGVLTRIGAALDSLGLAPAAPPFHVQPSALFGNGLGALTKFVPVSLAGYYSLPSASNIDQTAVRRTGHGFSTTPDMLDEFDQARINSRHGVTKLLTNTFDLHRRAARVIGARLAQTDMAVASTNDRNVALGTVALPSGQTPLTNGMLYDLFTRAIGPTGTPYRDQAIDAALAIRLLQLGSPAVTLEIGNFDFHSGERTGGPAIYGFFGRLWATLRWLLPRIPDPSGDGSMFDRTLVVTMSDFGRDKATASGWNGGEGTDHGADYACYYLAHAVMGGGTTPNKLVGPVDTNTYNASSAPIRYTTRQLLVSMLDALGLDPHDEAWGLPTGGDPIAELWT
jgi:uncharacterized protein (DUF1501 family)